MHGHIEKSVVMKMPEEFSSELMAIATNDSSLDKRYWGSFAACSMLCLALQTFNRKKSSLTKPSNFGLTLSGQTKFSYFQKTYLIVFMLAMFADWLQGPYVYELYVSYGFSQSEIAELFVGGFAASMVVGTMIGGLAHKIGRKTVCLLYSITYISACSTKIFQYWTLMLGRLLSGISTSLLFSVFESWMVCEHYKQ